MNKFARIAAPSAVAAAIFIWGIGSAFAGTTSASTVKATTSSSTTSTTSSTVPTTCVGANALKSVSYTVNGKTVTGLRGQATQGATVAATFTVKTGCDNVKLGMAAYQADSPSWVPAEAPDQVLTDSQAGTFSADGKSHTFSVKLDSCYYQVDFFTGVPVAKLDQRGGYFDGNLIAADNGGTVKCTPPVKQTCPTTTSAHITDVSYTINGVAGFKELEGHIKAGDKVTANFTVDAGCSNEVISLASYEAQNGTFNTDNIVNQVLFSKATGTFSAGNHTLSITVPNCFFQVDFVTGSVITKFGPAGSSNFYGSRVIDSTQGGTACEVTTEPPVRNTTTSSTSTTSTTSTTLPTQVLGEQITSTTTDPTPAVEGAQLAYTGAGDTIPLSAIGGMLTLTGVGLQSLAMRLRRRNK